MTKIAKRLEDREAELVDEDDSSVDETKKAVGGFTPTQKVSWPHSTAVPPKEGETALEADSRTRGEGGRTSRLLVNREEAEKARQDDHRPDSAVGDSHRGSHEARLASGFTQQAGKHTAYTGPMTRGGRLKIFPESVDVRWMEGNTDELERIANAILSPRDLVIFRARVIDPLMGRDKTDIDKLAKQLNISAKRVYKSVDGSWQKVAAAHRASAPPKDAAERALIDAWQTKCRACGRPWALAWGDVCPEPGCWFFRGGKDRA